MIIYKYTEFASARQIRHQKEKQMEDEIKSEKMLQMMSSEMQIKTFFWFVLRV